jgi:hypothetical protein
MGRRLTMLTVTVLLSMLALAEDKAPAQAPLSGVASVLSMDDSPRRPHP